MALDVSPIEERSLFLAVEMDDVFIGRSQTRIYINEL